MKKLFIVLFALAALLPADNKPIQFTLGNWLWKPTGSLSGYLKADWTVAPTANQLANPYQFSRLVPVLALTDGATQAISAAQCQNYVIHNGSCTQAIELDLPAAAVGMQITVYVAAAFTVKLDPNLTDQIMVYTGTAGDYLISDAVVGTAISLVCLIANKWHIAGATGSWTEE